VIISKEGGSISCQEETEQARQEGAEVPEGAGRAAAEQVLEDTVIVRNVHTEQPMLPADHAAL